MLVINRIITIFIFFNFL